MDVATPSDILFYFDPKENERVEVIEGKLKLSSFENVSTSLINKNVRYATKINWKSQGFGDKASGFDPGEVDKRRVFKGLVMSSRSSRKSRLYSPYDAGRKSKANFRESLEKVAKFSCSLDQVS